jgi:Arf-GAP/coiled-coil/ANK repeat/PH domain-containing protein
VIVSDFSLYMFDSSSQCSTKDPDWISINLGVMICIVCSGIHRSLGVHVSKVRSIVLDDLDTELLDMMVSLGNIRVNALWEGGKPEDVHKPHPGTGREQKEEFIQSKYVKKLWLAPNLFEPISVASAVPPEERYAPFLKACESDDLESVVIGFLRGLDLSWKDPSDHHKTPMHHAAQCDAILVVEFLIQNNADPLAEDDEHRTPLDYAKEAAAARVQARLAGIKAPRPH